MVQHIQAVLMTLVQLLLQKGGLKDPTIVAYKGVAQSKQTLLKVILT